MNRDQALEELKLRLFNKRILLRSLAVEAIMEELARHFNADVHLWGLTGLLHDIDYDKTQDQPQRHGMVGAEILENLDVDETVIYSVRAHNDANNIPRKRKLDKALYLSDFVSDHILDHWSANAESLEGLSAGDIVSSMEKAGFDLNKFDETGLTVKEFVEIALEAFQKKVTVL